MQPIRNNVLVKLLPPKEITDGGLLVPESARKENNKVHIVAVGNGTANKPMFLKPGQDVYRVKEWGTEVIIDGEKHYLMDQDAIIALN